MARVEECYRAYRKPLRIITLSNTEQSLQRVVSWDHKSGDVGKELTSNVEEDEEEIRCDKAQESIYFGNRSLLLQIVQSRILGELHKCSVGALS